MPYVKSPYFSSVAGSTFNATSIRDAIVSALTSVGITTHHVGTGPGGQAGAVFTLNFSNATRGTVYWRILVDFGSTVWTQVSGVPIQTNATFVEPFIPELAISNEGWNYLATDADRVWWVYYRANEGVVLCTKSAGRPVNTFSVFSPEVKFDDWDENLYPHVFSSYSRWTDANDYRLWGFYRGTNPNFFNPFPNTTNGNPDRVDVRMRDFPNIGRNPLNQIDIHTAPFLTWYGVQNYGYVGQMSQDFGFCSSFNLQPETKLVFSPTEEWEVIQTSSNRAIVLRTL